MIADNFKNIKQRIRLAAERVGRNPNNIRLVAVSKEHSVTAVAEGIRAGSTIFGENKVQGAKDKIKALGHDRIEWHFIGHLQKNKVKFIFDLFDLVHSVDSLALAEAIHKKAEDLGSCMPILLQVNVSGELSKFGVDPKNVTETICKIMSFKGVNIKGLMTIPPYDSNPEKSRPYYACLRELRDTCLKLDVPRLTLDELSMGMSNDYEVAVEEGSTLVRVGTALFGERSSKSKDATG